MAALMLGVGQNIERYVVEDYVGHGGMAVVYRVRHVDLGTLHALKVLTVARPAVRERLLQEGRAQAGLRHPNVVGVTDVIRVDGSLALVMEYVDGPDLAKWLQKYGKAEPDECKALVRGLCDGLGEAHIKGIVHRDLKPQNVLLEPTPGGFRAKITDFGIAKILEEGQGERSTKGNITMGTPNYMAPEQVRDAASADHRADLFALGAILYEAATGKLAFPGNDVLTVLNAVAAGNYERPSESHMPLDPSLIRVIEGCLEVDPAKRYASCPDVLAALGAEVPESARIPRGAGITDWVDAEGKRARVEWLATAPPSMERKLAAPDTTNGEIGEEITEQISASTRMGDEITPGVPVAEHPASGAAATVPRPGPRKHLPEVEQEEHESVSTAVLVVRRVVMSALVGTLLGLIGFLLLVRLTDWPRSMLMPAPKPTPVGLDDLVNPEPQPEPQP